jgi:hypothetical protein
LPVALLPPLSLVHPLLSPGRRSCRSNFGPPPPGRPRDRQLNS